MKLSLIAAREILLAAQGLNQSPARPATKEDCLAAIRRMGLLQIDTISVVARSPYLVLRSRVGDYVPGWLDELLAEGALFEYWSHAACFLPIEDFPIYRHKMLAHRESETYLNDANGENTEPIRTVLERIQKEGSVRSVEFQRTDQQAGSWWNWKPEKVASERMFNAGILMIARREGFQRVYDLRERILPDWYDSRALPQSEARKSLILKAVRALGVARTKWLPSYFPDYLRYRNSTQDIRNVLEEAIGTGEVFVVSVEDWTEPIYVHQENRTLVEQAIAGSLHSTVTTLLSPFDPVVSDRARTLEMFGFTYRIEIYTPEARRQYGYFSMPVLHRGELVGRLDAKAHRRDGLFEIKALHFEDKTVLTDTLLFELALMLQEFARWHNTPEIVLRHCVPSDFGAALNDALTTSQPPPS